MYECMNVCMYSQENEDIGKCACMCMYVSMYVCMHIRIYVCKEA